LRHYAWLPTVGYSRYANKAWWMGGRRRDASVPQSFERLEHAALRESWLDNEFTLLGVGQQISATSDLWGTLRKGLITCLPRVGDGDVTRLLVAPARSDRVWHRAMDHTAAKQCTVKHCSTARHSNPWKGRLKTREWKRRGIRLQGWKPRDWKTWHQCAGCGKLYFMERRKYKNEHNRTVNKYLT